MFAKCKRTLTPCGGGLVFEKLQLTHVTSHQFDSGHCRRACRRRGVLSGVTDKIPALTKQRDDEHTAKVTALAELANTKTNLAKTKSDLTQTQQDLADTKADRDKAVARGEAQTKRADELADKLAKAMQERDDAQNQLAAYKASDLTPDQVIKLNKNLKDAQDEIEAINGEKTCFDAHARRRQGALDEIRTGQTISSNSAPI